MLSHSNGILKDLSLFLKVILTLNFHQKLILDPEHGRVFEKSIYSLWLDSLGEYILKQSEEIFEYKKAKNEVKEFIRKESIRNQSNPSAISELHIPNIRSPSSDSSTSEEDVQVPLEKNKSRKNTEIIEEEIKSKSPSKSLYDLIYSWRVYIPVDQY